MDLYSTTDLNILKSEIARRYGMERGERPGPPSSLRIMLRARAAEREHLQDMRRTPSHRSSRIGRVARAALRHRRAH